ncbi:MAG: hypothetical protein L0207_05360 [Chlamydiae bacterium]|nr:hypothetical protein [Chlamydiota bacterium]
MAMTTSIHGLSSINQKLDILNDSKDIEQGDSLIKIHAIRKITEEHKGKKDSTTTISKSPSKISPKVVWLQIEKRISQLEFGKNTFTPQVRQLIYDIKNFKKNFPEFYKFGDGLEIALKALIEKEAFDFPIEERLYIQIFHKDKAFQFEQKVEKFIQDVRKELLTSIQTSVKERNLVTLEKKVVELQMKFIGLKWSPQEQDLFLEAKTLLLLFKKHSKEPFNQVYKGADQKTNGKFSKIIEIYSPIDLQKQIDHLSEELLTTFYLLKLNNEKIVHEDLIKFIIDEAIDCKKTRYDWLIKNVSFIKQPYNQSDDIHRKLKTGTCFANTCEREILLKKRPSIPSDKIPMGSTNKGRFQQVIHQQNPNLKTINNTYKTFGLKLEKSLSLGLHNSIEPILDGLFSQPSLPNKTCVMSLNNQKKGHVINVQFDEFYFRFIDDNLGVVEYPSLNALKKGLQTYLKTFYSNYCDDPNGVLEIRFFQKIDQSLGSEIAGISSSSP